MKTSREAQIFTNYLLKADADECTIFLYQKGIETGQFELNGYECFLLTVICVCPSFCAVIDHTSAIFGVNNGIRKRLFLTLSILETHPDHSGCFLKTPSLSSMLTMLLIGISKTFFYTLIGLIACPIFYVHYYGNCFIRLHYRRFGL